MLARLGDKSLIEHTYINARASNVFDEVIVATDDQSIVDAFEHTDAKVLMTDKNHVSGTDRVGEIANQIEADIFINIQGDEPFVEKEVFQSLVDLIKNENINIGTLIKKVKTVNTLFDYHNVKVVKDDHGKCLYFSRQAIPGQRDLPYKEWLNEVTYYQHIGIYGFKRDILLDICQLPPHPIEQVEKLEQLRWLCNGYDIYANEVNTNSIGIDTQEDLELAREMI